MTLSRQSMIEETSEERKKRLNREKQARYRTKNPDRVREVQKKSYDKHAEARRASARVDAKTRAWTSERNIYQNKYRAENADKIRKYNREYKAKRRLDDLEFRLAERVRSRVSSAKRGGSGLKSLGCTLFELIQHIEFHFKPGMTWENYGPTTWHLDHIKPLCSFELEDPVQFAEACHFTNLQPLWAVENLSKGGRVVVKEPLEPSSRSA